MASKYLSDFVVVTSSNLGIGMMPSTTVDALGVVRASTGLSIGETTTSGNAISDGFIMFTSNNFYATNSDGILFEKTDGNQAAPGGGISFSRRGNTGVRYIDMTLKGGNIGIANSNPAYKLDVSGDGHLTGKLYVDGGGLYPNTATTTATNFLINVSGGTLTVNGPVVSTGSVAGGTQVYAPAADSASIPGFSWASNSNTGLYSPVADTVAITCGGTETIRSSLTQTLFGSGGTLSANANYNFLFTDLNIDSTALSANRTHRGFYNTIGSMAVKGTYSNTIQGIYNELTNSSTNYGIASAATMTGVHNYLTNYSSNNVAGYCVDTMHGTYNWLRQVRLGTTSNMYGTYNRLYRDAGTVDKAYGVYNSFEGTLGTCYGVYSTGEDYNYFSGNVGIGQTTPSTYKLDVNGDGHLTGKLYVDGGGLYPNTTTTTATNFLINVSGGTLTVNGPLVSTGSVAGGTQVYAPASDSASIPGFSWASDSNTGLYSPAADAVAISCGGTETIRSSLTQTTFGSGGTLSANASYNFLFTDLNIDNTALSANRTYRGFYNTIGSMATLTGTYLPTMQGIYNEVINASTDYGIASASAMTGVYNYLASQSSNDVAGYCVNNMYGTYNYVRQLRLGTTSNMYGTFNYIRRDAGTADKAYGVYNLFSGTIGTSYGIYSSGESNNYLSGSLGIGTATPAYKLDVTGDMRVGGTLTTSITATGAPTMAADGGTGDRVVLLQGSASLYPCSIGIGANSVLWNGVPLAGSFKWYNGGNVIMQVTSTGDLSVTGDVAGFSTSLSDSNFKENIQSYTGWRDVIPNLEVKSFTWRSNAPMVEKRGTEDVGLIAQDVHAVYPKAHKTMEMEGNTYELIKYETFIPLLLAAVKDLQKENMEIKAQLAELMKNR